MPRCQTASSHDVCSLCVPGHAADRPRQSLRCVRALSFIFEAFAALRPVVSCYNTAPKFTIGKSLIGVRSLRASGASWLCRIRSDEAADPLANNPGPQYLVPSTMPGSRDSSPWPHRVLSFSGPRGIHLVIRPYGRTQECFRELCEGQPCFLALGT